MEQELVERAGIDYISIDTGALRGKNPLAAARNAGRMLNGVRQSLSLLSRIQPDVCLVTGGYVCAPIVAAARRRRIPVLIYLPDMSPGSAIRWLSRMAQRVAVTFPPAARYFGGTVAEGGKAVVTGYPVRSELVAAAKDRTAARQRLATLLDRPSLAPAPSHATGEGNSELPLLLVWGGSQGSRSINIATWTCLPQLLPLSHVVHVVGVRDWERSQPVLEAMRTDPEWQDEWRTRYHPVDYLHDEMPWALAAAELTIARAGASILGEFPVAGLPSILVPLPIAGVAQQLNAERLQEEGGAIVVDDAKLDTELAPAVEDLLSNRDRLQKMETAVRGLAKPDAAAHIVKELESLSAT